MLRWFLTKCIGCFWCLIKVKAPQSLKAVGGEEGNDLLSGLPCLGHGSGVKATPVPRFHIFLPYNKPGSWWGVRGMFGERKQAGGIFPVAIPSYQLYAPKRCDSTARRQALCLIKETFKTVRFVKSCYLKLSTLSNMSDRWVLFQLALQIKQSLLAVMGSDLVMDTQFFLCIW